MEELIYLTILIAVGILIAGFATGIRVVRPTDRGLVELLGKYQRFSEPGLTYIIPFINKLYKVNITEQMVDIDRQQIITKDNLNATVAAQVYFKIKPDEESVKNSQYQVNDVETQIVSLAQTTLRNIIGTLTLTDANTKRSKINGDLMQTLAEETKNWGIEVVRTELREIDPPNDVQATMNNVVKAENEKIAAKDYATAAETKADGERRAAIKEAEGKKKATILNAEGYKEALILDGQGRAQQIKLVNEAGDKYFVGNAQLLRKLEAVENSLKNNSKIYLPEGESLVNVVGGLAGDNTPIIIPETKKQTYKTSLKETEQKQETEKTIKGGRRGN